MASLDYTIGSEVNITSILSDGKMESGQVVEGLKELVDKVFELEKQVDEIVNAAERLDYKTNDYV